MRIGLLQCDHVLPEHQPLVTGDCDYLYSQALRSAATRLKLRRTIEIVSYPVVDEVFPNSPTTCDAWIVTASRFSANDRLSWMIRLQKLIREIFDLRIGLVGICFGHQIISATFGGTVLSRDDWVIGVKCLEFRLNHIFSVPKARLLGLHRDEVVDAPSIANVIASTAEVENAALIIMPSILTIQYHFELPRDYYLALLHARDDTIPDSHKAAAISSLEDQTDEDPVADSVLSFLLSGDFSRTRSET